jgi:hypothetical protein
MAMLLKKQKPIALARSAWCPGGRTLQKAFSASPADHQVGRQYAGAGRAQRRLSRCRAHGGVRVEVDDAAFRCAVADMAADVLGRMHSGNLLERGQRRIVEGQIHVEPGGDQPVADGGQALRAFGMMRPHVMQPTVAMRDECGGHD